MHMADFFAQLQYDQIAVMKFVLACLDAHKDNATCNEPGSCRAEN